MLSQTKEDKSNAPAPDPQLKSIFLFFAVHPFPPKWLYADQLQYGFSYLTGMPDGFSRKLKHPPDGLRHFV
jgi:hypothetical protein